MEKFNTDITQVLKWLQNEAPNIQSLVNKKNDWYIKYNDRFWADWYANVFNLKTANAFGVYVWCEILGVPKTSFVLTPSDNQWAYGGNRKNYVPTDGGNFFGAGVDTVTGIEEARFALLLRYAALTSDGRIENINRMLSYIFNDGKPWTGNKYFICVDDTQLNSSGSETVELNYRANDWQGDLPLSRETRTQIGYFNHYISGPLGGPFSGSYAWSGAGLSSTTYFGGDTKLYTAPNGEEIATGLKFTLGAQQRLLFGNMRINNNNRYITSIYIKVDEMPDTDIILDPNANLRYDGIAQGTANVMGRNEIYTCQTTLIKVVGGKAVSAQAIPSKVSIPTAAGGGTYTFSTNAAMSGMQDVGNGWVRVWAGFETTNASTWQSTQGTVGLGPSAVIISPTAVLKVWGAMVEVIKNASTLPNSSLPSNNSPGRFWITNKSASATVEVSRPDFTVDTTVSPAQIVFPQNLVGPYESTKPVPVSSLEDGTDVTYTGRYYQIDVTNPVYVGTGDGTTLRYNVPEPPGFFPPFEVPMAMRYITKGFNFTPQFINLLSDRDAGMIPSNAGIQYDVVQFI